MTSPGVPAGASRASSPISCGITRRAFPACRSGWWTPRPGSEVFAMRDRGEVQLVQTVASAITPNEERFASHELAGVAVIPWALRVRRYKVRVLASPTAARP